MSDSQPSALITGAGSGIGRAAADLFAERGYAVALLDRDPVGLQETAGRINALGGRVLSLETDVASWSGVGEAVSATVNALGGIDYAFNNAGVAGQGECDLHDLTEQDFDEVMDINLKGTWICMKQELAVMVRQGYGSIVNGASVASFVGFDKLSAYTASKHGIIGLTKSAALEYASTGIRINAVCPGVVDTPFTTHFTGGDATAEQRFRDVEPMNRFAQPSEVAHAVIWLCSREASFVTGTSLMVDGGLTSR